MNHSIPGLPVHHQLPEFTQTHVHQVGDAIQPSHPLSSPSPPALQSLPASGGQSIGVSASASVLPINTQNWSPLGWTSWISLQSKGLWRVLHLSSYYNQSWFQLVLLPAQRTVVLEKTLMSPLDCKEIQLVHSEGDQSWVFFGRTDAKSWNSNILATS